jgi:hypothetical protein
MTSYGVVILLGIICFFSEFFSTWIQKTTQNSLLGFISFFGYSFSIPITFGIYVVYEMHHLNIYKYDLLPSSALSIPKVAIMLIPGIMGVSFARSRLSKKGFDNQESRMRRR